MKTADNIKVTMVTAVCLIATFLLFRNWIDKSIDPLVALIPFYLFVIYMLASGNSKGSKTGIVVWNLVIILATFLVILINLIK
jgi:hypothetical protein